MHSNNTLPRSPQFTCTPPARLPPRPPLRPLGPGSPEDPKQLEDSLYSWVPLNSIKRVIVVFCNLDNAERPCQASDRYYSPPTASTPEITLRVFRGAHTVLVPVQLSGPPPDWFYNIDSDDESAIFESPPSHIRTQLPDLTPRKPTCWLGTDVRGVPPTRSPSLRASSACLSSSARGGNRRIETGKTLEAPLAICPRMRMGSC